MKDQKKYMSVAALQQRLNNNEPVLILDVRPEQQREEWHIKGSKYINAYTALNEGDHAILDGMEIPKNVPVVTVCAAGKTSKVAADILRAKGIEAYSLEGGMKAWNYAWNSAELLRSNFRIIQVRRVAKGCLSYIIGSGKEAMVVDASLDPEVYLSLAGENEWTISYVMDTHIHADYLSRTRELAEFTGAKHLFMENAAVEYPFEAVRDGDRITLGNTYIEVLHTPGHTPESASYLVNKTALLTGDTLFVDGVGRPDLKAGPEEVSRKAGDLYGSLQRIRSLAAQTLILPAHVSQPISFDGRMIKRALVELQSDIELLQLSKEAFISASLGRIPPTPPNYQTIAGLNKKGSFHGYEPAELEAGANRCAVA